MTDQAKTSKILAWMITIITPLIIMMLAIRILMTPLFARIEYHLPGFPEDPYGFSTADRLVWSRPSINYLTNAQGIDYLEVLTFDDGEPIFNDGELSHMEDVKALVTVMRYALAGGMLVLLLLTVLLARWRQHHLVLHAYSRGAWGVVGIIAGIIIFIITSFNQLFTYFHQLFFEEGTWMFYPSDTLIRLFPIRFWQDAFIGVGVLSLIFAGILIILNRNKRLSL
jgi:integral membrane protein (TIGR01906 family)